MRGKNQTHLTIFFLITLLLAGCTERGCSSLFNSGKEGVPVVVEEVKLRRSSPIMRVYGKIMPSNKVIVSYPEKAKIGEVYIDRGSIVNSGDRLFSIDEAFATDAIQIKRARQKELKAKIKKETNLLSGRKEMAEEGKIEQEEIKRLEQNIETNRLELERIEEELKHLSYVSEHVFVSSPMSGMISEKNIFAGEKIEAGEELISIVEINPIIAHFSVRAEQSPDISLGMPFDINIEELPDRSFDATVTFVSPELHSTGKAFDILVSIPNDDLILKSGMTAIAEFKSENLKDIYLVPKSAVFSFSSKPYVYRVKRGLAHKTFITISSVKDNTVEVISGLDEGDIVVAKGGEDLFDGVEVSIWR